MSVSCLGDEKKNFNCVVSASLQLTKLPLKDILASQIKPSDLKNKIQTSLTLLSGKHQLLQEQKHICYLKSAGSIDYEEFDVTLLYKLIRNLCPSLTPTKGWGNVPDSANIQIGDDIERLRIFRNNYAHPKSATISDTDFNAIWTELKYIIKRIQSFLANATKYEQKLLEIEQDELKYEPEILIKGENKVICGDVALFEADVKHADPIVCSITWRKRKDDEIILIDTRKERYSGSTKRKLLISNVCKEDEGIYDAILSREINGADYKSRNTIHLHVLGELPQLKNLNVTTEDRRITIHYIYKVPGQHPKVHHIQWSKNDQPLDKNDNELVGGSIHDSRLTILSPTTDDKGKYTCTVFNAVGFVSKDVTLDVPSVTLSPEPAGCFGTEITITPLVLSTPSPQKAKWQKSKDGINFQLIDIYGPNYVGSTDKPECPILVISRTTFEDRLYYRFLVWNEIGQGVSNTVYLNITGSPPNIIANQETNIKNRYVKLIGNVFLYDGSPDILEVFWTKNGKKIYPQESGGRLSGVTIDDPSLTIREVCRDDAGCYQLTAINAVGSTRSDEIDLDIPDVTETKIEKREDGSTSFLVKIQSFPAPLSVHWSYKGKYDNKFTPIDVSAENYKGTTNSLPNPMLVVKKENQLENNNYQIEIANFVGSTVELVSCFKNSTYKKTKEKEGNYSKEDIAAQLFLNEQPQPLKKNLEKDTSTESIESLEVQHPQQNVQVDFTQSVAKLIRESGVAPQNVTVPSTYTLSQNAASISLAQTVCAMPSFSTPTMANRKSSMSLSGNGSYSEMRHYKEQDVKFIMLCLHLSRHFPCEKLDTLKLMLEAYGKIGSDASLERANSAKEYVRLLLHNKLLTSDDVIFMQFICNVTECDELYVKCLEYALAHESLCFFEKRPDDGFKRIKFHIKRNIHDFDKRKIRMIVNVVADILKCAPGEIQLSGILPSPSFFLVLSVHECENTRKLQHFNEQERLRLTNFDIDFFIVDEKIYTLNSPKELHTSEKDEEKGKNMVEEGCAAFPSEKTVFFHEPSVRQAAEKEEEEDESQEAAIEDAVAIRYKSTDKNI